mmetsp:Transcript_21553/g.63799  ORF Transcript_21553/g.63799 Transcript_21553/m.63799 type:complete len:258 (-) Transcript_21553:249-1022(-)
MVAEPLGHVLGHRDREQLVVPSELEARRLVVPGVPNEEGVVDVSAEVNDFGIGAAPALLTGERDLLEHEGTPTRMSEVPVDLPRLIVVSAVVQRLLRLDPLLQLRDPIVHIRRARWRHHHLNGDLAVLPLLVAFHDLEGLADLLGVRPQRVLVQRQLLLQLQPHLLRADLCPRVIKDLLDDRRHCLTPEAWLLDALEDLVCRLWLALQSQATVLCEKRWWWSWRSWLLRCRRQQASRRGRGLDCRRDWPTNCRRVCR